MPEQGFDWGRLLDQMGRAVVYGTNGPPPVSELPNMGSIGGLASGYLAGGGVKGDQRPTAPAVPIPTAAPPPAPPSYEQQLEFFRNNYGLRDQPGPETPSPQKMTADELLANRGFNPHAGALPVTPPPAQLLGANGPGSQLDLMARQPSFEYNGNTAISRTIDKPALAAAMSGQAIPTTLLYTETQTPMDPGHIAQRLGGQLAPTQEQRALAEKLFSEYQQGAAGLMNAQTNRELGLGDLALRNKVELSGGIPTSTVNAQIAAKNAMDIAQLNAQNEDNKTADALIVAQIPKDQNGNPLPLNPGQAEALMRERMRLRLMGHPAGSVGQPPAGSPAVALTPTGAPTQDQHAQDVQTIQGGNAQGVGDSQMRAVNPAAVNALLAEKDAAGNWKYAGDPIMALARIRELLPQDQYAANPAAVKAFLQQHYNKDLLQGGGFNGNTRAGGGILSNLEPMGFGPGRWLAARLGAADRAQQTGQEIISRLFGINQPYWDAAADTRQLFPVP
jgi:hypothetical protein